MNLFRQLIQKQAGRNLQTPPSSDTIVVGCQSCKSHVPMHVMELSHSEPREILCRNCGHAVAFTRRSITHTHSRPSYRPSSGNLRTFVFRRSFGELVLNGRPVSVASYMTTNTGSSGSKRTTPTPSMKGKQRASRTSLVVPGGSPILHGSGSGGYRNYAEEGSMDGGPRSYRSSIISLSPKPSNSFLPGNFNGCEGLWDKSLPPRHSSGSMRYSVAENAGRSSSSLVAVLPNSSARSITLTDDGLRITNQPSNWGHSRAVSTGVPGSPQHSTESINQDSGSNHGSEHRQALLDRRASYPQRARVLPVHDLHRLAVSRRQSDRLVSSHQTYLTCYSLPDMYNQSNPDQEYQDEREAAARTSRRRSSIGSDFGVQPPDKDVRLANLIFTSPEEHERVDVNWARDVLWRHEAWQRNTRFQNPLRRSGVVNEPSSAVATASASTPRFSMQDIPPVKEEPSEPDGFGFRRFSSAFRVGTERAHAEHLPPHSGSAATSRQETADAAPQEPASRSKRRNVARRIRRRCGKALKTLISKFRRPCPGPLTTTTTTTSAISGTPARPEMTSSNRSQALTHAANSPDGFADVSNFDANQNDGERNGENNDNPEHDHNRDHDQSQGSDANASYVVQGELNNPSSEEVAQAEREVALAVAAVPQPLVQIQFRATPREIGFYPAI